jgi:hypothetical protein
MFYAFKEFQEDWESCYDCLIVHEPRRPVREAGDTQRGWPTSKGSQLLWRTCVEIHRIALSGPRWDPVVGGGRVNCLILWIIINVINGKTSKKKLHVNYMSISTAPNKHVTIIFK